MRKAVAILTVPRSKRLQQLALVGLLAAIGHAPAATAAQTCDSAFADAYVVAWQKAVPIPYGDEIHAEIDSFAKARCHQDRVIAGFFAAGRRPIGYKVAASSRKSQEALNTPGPIPAVLFDGMLLPSGGSIASRSGVFLVYEADMLVRVSDAAIMQAETPLDVARSLDRIIPFIEVADGMVTKGTRITGTLIQAMNGASRWGVTGEAIAVEATPDFVAAVAAMTVTLSDETGSVVSQAPGTAILGHPFNAVLFLIARAKERGWDLKKGDLLSLGSFGRFAPVRPGGQAHLLYEGLPGGPRRVEVRFD